MLFGKGKIADKLGITLEPLIAHTEIHQYCDSKHENQENAIYQFSDESVVENLIFDVFLQFY